MTVGAIPSLEDRDRLRLAPLGRDYTHVACENASHEWKAPSPNSSPQTPGA